MYMQVSGQMGAVYSFCNVFMCTFYTKDVSQCEVTHQLPFVGASPSVCQGPWPHSDHKRFHCDLSNITVVQKTTCTMLAVVMYYNHMK